MWIAKRVQIGLIMCGVYYLHTAAQVFCANILCLIVWTSIQTFLLREIGKTENSRQHFVSK